MTLRFGRYETIQPIASGGMAAVYLGRATGEGGFERRVAIKVMHEHIADDPEFVAMFLDEARLAARIHHPNVVGTIDVQKGAQGMFIVMEYIEGASLKKVLHGLRKKRQRMPFGITARVLIDALNGLHVAHDLKTKTGQMINLVHRDVSPHNVLVGTDGVSRITDFGVARAEARLSTTRGGQLKGKIAYMPPEQGLGHDIDRRADIYAAGVLMWEMLCGRRLFKADHDGQLVAMILQGVQQSPREACPDVPESLNDVCMRALSIRPDDRFPTAAHFAEALEQAMYDAGLRLASTRQVAAFVDEYKVEITHGSLPPSPPVIEDTATGHDSMPSGIIDVASMPSIPSLPTPSEPSNVDDGSSLTGVGAVHSQVHAPIRSRRGLFVGAGVITAAIVAVVGVTALGRDDAPPPVGSHVAEQAQTLAHGVQQNLVSSSSKAEVPPPPAPPAPDPSVSGSALADAPPVRLPPRGVPTPKPPVPGKGSNGNPLDYDPPGL